MKCLNKIYNEDCLEGMKDIPDKSIDCIICDLPYGTTPCKWDSIIDFNLLWEQYERIIKDNGAICLFGQEPFSSLLRCSNIKLYKYDWYWQKERLTNVFQVKRRPGKVIECISIFYKKQPTYNPQMTNYEGQKVTNKIGKNAKFSITQSVSIKQPTIYNDNGTRYPLQVLRINRDSMYDERLHPTQKPIELIEYLIKTYSNEGDIILDNCIGSGTTAVAAMNTNRNFIGFELDKNYFDIAIKRIENLLPKGGNK